MRFEPTSPNLRIRLLAFCWTREEAGMRLAGVFTPLQVPKMPLAEPPPRGPGGRTAGLQRPHISPVTQSEGTAARCPMVAEVCGTGLFSEGLASLGW